MQLSILSAGAAQALVRALAPQLEAETGCGLDGIFGAVGAMRQKLLDGTPADLIILTRAQIAELAASGRAAAGQDLGTVRTGIAVRSGDPLPAIGDTAALEATLAGADALYFPDPELATAGIHFRKVLDALGIAGPALRTFPNGATAMAALATAGERRPIGCTQVTEILATPGTTLVGPLPTAFELATVYSVGICAGAALPEVAERFATMIAGDGAAALRATLGFEAA